MIKDGRAILRAGIGTLSIERGRIVDGKEDLQQLLERGLLRIENDLNHLGVAGRSPAYLFIRRVGQVASRVAGSHFFDAAQVIEDRFQAPEASSGECRCLSVTV